MGFVLVTLLWSLWPSGGAPLEAALQRAANHGMAGRPGAAAVAEVGSGRLLAHYRLAVAASRRASPGSTVKPLVWLRLLETGRLGPEDRLVCPRRLRLAGRRLDCSHPEVGLPLDPAGALAYSCNCHFVRFGSRLEAGELAGALEGSGVVSLTGWAAQEAPGTVRLAATLEELQLQLLGESHIEVTALGLLNAYRRLALLRRKNPARLSLLFEGLESATCFGTAQLAQAAGLKVAGKTGTGAGPGGGTHAWFVGYAPAEAPEIVVVVFLESGRGGTSAAPVAGGIFQAYARRQPR